MNSLIVKLLLLYYKAIIIFIILKADMKEEVNPKLQRKIKRLIAIIELTSISKVREVAVILMAIRHHPLQDLHLLLLKAIAVGTAVVVTISIKA